jgi:hypothetical protein
MGPNVAVIIVTNISIFYSETSLILAENQDQGPRHAPPSHQDHKTEKAVHFGHSAEAQNKGFVVFFPI